MFLCNSKSFMKRCKEVNNISLQASCKFQNFYEKNLCINTIPSTTDKEHFIQKRPSDPLSNTAGIPLSRSATWNYSIRSNTYWPRQFRQTPIVNSAACKLRNSWRSRDQLFFSCFQPFRSFFVRFPALRDSTLFSERECSAIRQRIFQILRGFETLAGFLS